MNEVDNSPLEKRNKEHHENPVGWKKLEKRGCNGQEVRASTSDDMRCTRNDKYQLRQHSGWKWKVQNMSFAIWKHLDETPVRIVMIDTTLQLNMDKHEKNMIFEKTRWWVNIAAIQSLRKKWKNAKKRTEKKTTCSTSNEFERASLKRRIEWSCWEINNEKNRLVEGLWKISQELEVKTCHKWKQDWIDMNKETRNFFHWEDKWRTWVIYKHHK